MINHIFCEFYVVDVVVSSEFMYIYIHFFYLLFKTVKVKYIESKNNEMCNLCVIAEQKLDPRSLGPAGPYPLS